MDEILDNKLSSALQQDGQESKPILWVDEDFKNEKGIEFKCKIA